MNFLDTMKKTFKNYFVPHADNDHKPHFLREKSVATVAAITVILFAASIFGTYAVNHNKYLASIQAAFLVDLANDDREDMGLPKLTINDKLISAADMKAADMAAKSYFAHNSPDGKTPWYWIQKAGYEYVYAGENLAVNFSNSADVEEAWMDSPTHKANILHNKYSEIGIATASGTYKGGRTIFVVQMFGSPKKKAVTPAPKPVAAAPLSSPEVAAELSEANQIAVAPAPAIPTAVLGEEVKAVSAPAPIEETVAPALAETAADPVPEAPTYTNWFERLVVSPSKIVHDLYVALAAIVVFALVLKIFIEIRLQHPKNIAYGLLLLLIIGVCVYMNQHLLADPVLVVGTL